jgi:signal transduction histidine kinase/HPt (histidine-containing phosphotransfer) domain-containing protein/ActR/RegA family two-component response regulator
MRYPAPSKYANLRAFALLMLGLLVMSQAAYAQVPQTQVPAAIPAPQVITPPTAAPFPVQAAPTVPTIDGIVLKEQSGRAILGNNFYVIPDPEKSYTAATIADKVSTGRMNSYKSPTAAVRLGSKSTTYWIVLPITNMSKSDIWELDFGGTLSGRQTFLSKLIVTNSFSNEVVFDSTLQGSESYSIGRKIRLALPEKDSGFVIIEARNPSGSLSTINLSLRQAYATNTSISLSEALSVRIPLLAATILLTAFALRRDYSFLALGAGWFLIFVHGYLIDNYIYFDAVSAQLLSPSIWLSASLCLLVGFWISEDMKREVPSSLFIGLGAMCLILGLIALLVSDFMPEVGMALSSGPPILVCLIYMGLSWPIAWRGINRTYFFLLMAGLLQLCTLAIALLITFDILKLPDTALYLSISHTTLLGAAIFMALYALLGYSPMYANELPQNNDSDLSKNNLDLAGAKEESEHKRLLQILEQERATMGEMQVQEARRTEEMRKAKEAADEANTAKSAFLAVVSHEIRTPMTGVMGMVRLLLDTSLSKEQKEFATTIQDSGEALMALLNDILDFEKIESGKLELESIDMDLHRLLRGVQTLMNGHAAAKNVELKLELDPKVPNFVVGDPTRLRQVLLNLVNNAIKFTAKGTVWLRVKDLSPDEQPPGMPHQIYFAVQDSGIGITLEVQKKLFMPFAQADATTARKYGGTGLGLAICKRLIEAMGDVINISSKAGEGSTFFFTLGMPVGEQHVAGSFTGAATGVMPEQPNIPPAPATSAPAPGMVSLNQPARFMKVLVVDDNGINQKVLKGMIEKDGHSVTLAGTGMDALDKHMDSIHDVILLDIELPDINGHEVTRKIRALEDKAKASIPIVAMTGNTSQEDIAACYAAGMDGFMGKPIEPDKLKSILQKASIPGGLAKAQPTQPAPKDTTGGYVPMPPPAPATLPQNVSGFGFDFPGAGDNEDEDTFASAIRKFEELESKAGTTGDQNLDNAIISSLKATLNPDQLQELLVSFYEKAEELIAAIEHAFMQNDLDNLRARAHELKGMSGNFGFSGVGTISGTIEKAAKDQVTAELQEHIKKLGEVYAISKMRMGNTAQ